MKLNQCLVLFILLYGVYRYECTELLTDIVKGDTQSVFSFVYIIVPCIVGCLTCSLPIMMEYNLIYEHLFPIYCIIKVLKLIT